MVVEANIGVISYFLPIAAFLLVLIVIYAILQKTKVLGDNPSVSLFISIILATFFIVDIQLVDFVTLTSSWFSVFVVFIFFLMLVLAFMPWDNNLDFLQKGNWFSWAVLVFMIVFFVISSSYIFNWAINWDFLMSGTDSEWFGFALLIVIGGAVSFVLTKKVK